MIVTVVETRRSFFASFLMRLVRTTAMCYNVLENIMSMERIMLKKRLRFLTILTCVVCMINAGFAEEKTNAYQRYLDMGEYPSLYERWQDDFRIGTAVSSFQLKGKFSETVIKNFSSVTCENEMKAEAILDRKASIEAGNPNRAALHFDAADRVMTFAMENGIKVRAHNLIWHSQTPRWFFTEGYSDQSDAVLVDRKTMIARMENYIKDEMEHFNTKFPGVIYAWDVVNEAIETGNGEENSYRMNSLWYEVIGPDYIELAFTFARKYAAPEQKLFYNDYSETDSIKKASILKLLYRLKAKGVIDGMGMQMHIGPDSPNLTDMVDAIRLYSEAGMTIHLTEMDVTSEDPTAYGQMLLAARYRSVINMCKYLKDKNGYDIESITFWGVSDASTWLTDSSRTCYPLLFDAKLNPKPAFFGALLDDSIPKNSRPESIQQALDILGLEKINEDKEATSDMDTLLKTAVKAIGEHNPLMVQEFGADPWAMVYKDRVYIYMTGDQPVMGMDGSVPNNTYGNINTIRVISSDDLVNWTDHGAIRAAGSQGAAKWAKNSWAPAAAVKNIDGQDKFFLYFADSGNGIGVLTADSPVGPFSDPLGHAIINRATPTCASVTWLFDPAVLVDDDGRAFLYVGGGVPEGKQADPGTARVVELNEDMISLKGSPVAICPPYLFEDSGINKFGDQYYYSYCTNFNVSAGATKEFGFNNGEIAYMVSDDPMGPFEYRGCVLKNPEYFFGVGGNNHHCMFEFNDRMYITYHAATLEGKMGMKGKGYRSTFINELTLDPATGRLHAEGNLKGVDAIKALEANGKTAGVTVAFVNGVTMVDIEGSENGTGRAALFSGDGLSVLENVDFGKQNGKQILRVRYESQTDAQIEFRVEPKMNEKSDCIGKLPGGEGWQIAEIALDSEITGTHAAAIRVTGEKVLLDWWQMGR